MKKTLVILLVAFAAVSLFVSCRNNPTDTGYKIGDRGPAGGYIFYINENAGSGEWKYLEAAPEDLSGSYKWGSDGTHGTDTAIGKGQSNTKALMEAKKNDSSLSFPAAEECDKYTYGGYDDWFLPSSEELNEMYKNLASADKGGTWQEGWYWSSSEKDSDHTYYQSFLTGSPSDNLRGNNTNCVRPVRMF